MGLNDASLTNRVADVLRLRLMAGEIPAGMRVNEAEIASEFEISRGPVREAVRLLTSEGLLEHRRHHGAAAPVLSQEQVTAVFELRTALECHAAELAAARITSNEITHLRDLCRLSNDTWHEGTRFPFQLDLQFHTALLEAARSPLLLRHGRLVHQQVVQLRAGMSVPAAHTYSSMDDHARITDAVAARDGQLARRLMSTHLSRVADQLHLSMSETNDPEEVQE